MRVTIEDFVPYERSIRWKLSDAYYATRGAYWPSVVGGFVYGFSSYHFAHAEGHETDTLQGAGVQRKEIPPGLRIQILHHRHRGFTDERKAACAGTAFACVAVRIQPEHANGYDQETSACQHRHRGQTPLPPSRAPAHGEHR